VTLAEIEIAKEDAPVPPPDWIGQDVTGMPEYKKLNILRARLTGAAWNET
jgi:CYTH domain-containing protein